MLLPAVGDRREPRVNMGPPKKREDRWLLCLRRGGELIPLHEHGEVAPVRRALAVLRWSSWNRGAARHDIDARLADHGGMWCAHPILPDEARTHPGEAIHSSRRPASADPAWGVDVGTLLDSRRADQDVENLRRRAGAPHRRVITHERSSTSCALRGTPARADPRATRWGRPQ